MKKLLIASVSVLALSAGAAFAGSSTSNVDQIGSVIGATIDQTNNGGNLTSNAYQGGNYYYGNGYAATNSSIGVTQIGDTGAIVNSTVQQNGDDQHATVNQTAAGASTQTSNIIQSNTANTAASNTATVTQTAVLGGSQISNVTQSGTYGSVTVGQYGPNDQSTVNQAGSHNNSSDWGGANTAALGLVGGGAIVIQQGSSSNTSTVNQYSDYSGVKVLQEGAATGSNISNITQNAGFSNDTAAVWQNAAAGVTNTSTINQTGFANTASVRQH